MFVPLFMMWLHLLATITWIGGMLFFWFLIRPASQKSAVTSGQREFLNEIEQRWMKLRWISLLGLIGTGIYNLIHEGDSARLESAWGGVLMIKLLLVAVAVGLSGIQDFILVPGRQAVAGSDPGRSRELLGAGILALALLIVLVAVYLGSP